VSWWGKKVLAAPSILPITARICEALEDPERVWVQTAHYFGCNELNISVWSANGPTQCEPDDYNLPALDKRCLWESLQVARGHQLVRKMEVVEDRMCSCQTGDNAPSVTIKLKLERGHIAGYQTRQNYDLDKVLGDHIPRPMLADLHVVTSGETPEARVTCSKCNKTFKVKITKLKWGHQA
jgi:hypothetical protein